MSDEIFEPEELSLNEGDAQLNAWLAAQNADGHRQQRFEYTVVKRILKHLGQKSGDTGIRQRYLEVTGSDEITLAGLVDVMGFNVYMESCKLRDIYKIDVPELFTRFPTSRMGKAFAELREQCPPSWDGPVGLAFQWPGLPGDYGICVVHDAPTDLTSGHMRFMQRVTANRRTADVVIETLASFLASVTPRRCVDE